MSADLEPYDPDGHGPVRRVVGRLIDPAGPEPTPELEPFRPVPGPVPVAARGRWVWLSGHATPQVRQHAADAAVLGYVVAVLAICAAVALVAAVVGFAAWHVLVWMGA